METAKGEMLEGFFFALPNNATSKMIFDTFV